MINPFTINPLALPSIKFPSFKELPYIEAIYFCLDAQGIPLYIGETKCLHNRWNWGHPKKKACLRAGVVKLSWWQVIHDPTSRSARLYRLSIETKLIRFHKPILNTVFLANRRRGNETFSLGLVAEASEAVS